MPLSRIAADAFGVVTICLVATLILLGFLSIAYTLYFRSRVCSQGFLQLSYFSGPWIIRIIFVLFVILWGFGELLRLSFLRRKGRALGSLDLQWQETVCKGYIVLNLGFSEPCLFLTLVLLIRAPLQKLETGILSQKWNWRTFGHVILWCSPVFVLQLFLVLIAPHLHNHKSSPNRLPSYFTTASLPVMQNSSAFCTYPLLNTIFFGVFATILTASFFWLGRNLLNLVINKVLYKRVYIMLLCVSTLLPLRILFLGLSVLSKPETFLFELLSFLGFVAISCCASVCIFLLVYYPVADSLSLGNIDDVEAGAKKDDLVSLLANEEITGGGSISFSAYEKEGTSTSSLVELSLFSPTHENDRSSSLSWPSGTPY